MEAQEELCHVDLPQPVPPMTAATLPLSTRIFT
jgi:hypothetical protein